LTPPRATRPTLRLPLVCLITDRSLATNRPLEVMVAAAVEGGVNMVQLREKDLPQLELLDLALRIRGAIGNDAHLVVNGPIAVAVDASADGVHLPSDGLATHVARQSCGGTMLLGRSVHCIAEVAAAVAEGVDYVELGTIYPSRSHPGGPAQGLGSIAAAARSGVPVLAVGGITAANAPDVIAAGASGVAVISAILADRDPRAAARRLADAVHEAWRRTHPAEAAGAARTALGSW
jgi:thiamine-phosphate pyrophosphorylase